MSSNLIIVHYLALADQIFTKYAECQAGIIREVFTNPGVTWADIEMLCRKLLEASPESLPALCASLGLPEPTEEMLAHGGHAYG